MDVFQSPIEAFALNFNYVSFDIFATTLQSLFTCFAILTAAISFWKFTTVGSNSFRRTKSSSSSSSSSLSGDHLDCHSSAPLPPPSLPDQKPESELELELEKKSSNVEQAASGCDFMRSDSSSSVGPISIEDGDEVRVNPKGKFTLYYSADELIREDQEEEEEEHMINCVCSSEAMNKLLNYDGRWCCDGFAARRVSDLASWYGYQDLTVLNGNVVRLWDCQRRRN